MDGWMEGRNSTSTTTPTRIYWHYLLFFSVSASSACPVIRTICPAYCLTQGTERIPVRSRTDTTCVWLWDCNNKILSNSLRWWAGLDNIRFSFHEPQSSTRKGRWKRKIRCSNLLSNRSLVFSLWLGKIPPFVKLILGWKIPFFNSIHYIEKFSSSNHTHTHYIRKIKNFKKLNFDQDIVK